MIIVRLLSPEPWLVCTTKFTRAWEPTLSWNQFHQLPGLLRLRYQDVFRNGTGLAARVSLGGRNLGFTAKLIANFFSFCCVGEVVDIKIDTPTTKYQFPRVSTRDVVPLGTRQRLHGPIIIWISRIPLQLREFSTRRAHSGNRRSGPERPQRDTRHRLLATDQIQNSRRKRSKANRFRNS